MDKILWDIYLQLKTASHSDHALWITVTLLGIYVYYKIRFSYNRKASTREKRQNRKFSKNTQNFWNQ